MDDLSVCASVRHQSVHSTALWKNDAVWRHRSDGSRDEAGSGVWASVHGKGYFWPVLGTNLGRPIVTNGDFTAYVCNSVSSVGTVRFGMVRAMCRGIAILHGGPRRARGRGVFGGFCSPFLPTVKCFRFVCENLTTFPFGKHNVGKPHLWAFGDIFSFKIKLGVYEKLSKK